MKLTQEEKNNLPRLTTNERAIILAKIESSSISVDEFCKQVKNGCLKVGINEINEKVLRSEAQNLINQFRINSISLSKAFSFASMGITLDLKFERVFSIRLVSDIIKAYRKEESRVVNKLKSLNKAEKSDYTDMDFIENVVIPNFLHFKRFNEFKNKIVVTYKVMYQSLAEYGILSGIDVSSNYLKNVDRLMGNEAKKLIVGSKADECRKALINLFNSIEDEEHFRQKIKEYGLLN